MGAGCSKFCLKVCCVLPIKVFLFELTYSLPGVCSNGFRTAHSCSSDPGALDDRTIRRCDLQADSLVAEECRESGSERARVLLQPPLQKRSLVMCYCLRQLVLNPKQCWHHQIGGQPATVQGTLSKLERNTRVPHNHS